MDDNSAYCQVCDEPALHHFEYFGDFCEACWEREANNIADAYGWADVPVFVDEEEAEMIFSCPGCHKVLAKEEGKPSYKATLVPIGGVRVNMFKNEMLTTVCPRCHKVVLLAKGVL